MLLNCFQNCWKIIISFSLYSKHLFIFEEMHNLISPCKHFDAINAILCPSCWKILHNLCEALSIHPHHIFHILLKILTFSKENYSISQFSDFEENLRTIILRTNKKYIFENILIVFQNVSIQKIFLPFISISVNWPHFFQRNLFRCASEGIFGEWF